jgi:cysteine desulfurase / selenocysteine lyase
MKKFLHLNEWLADEGERQRAFPATLWQTYFAHANVAPLPASSSEAMKAYLAQATQHGQLDLLHYEVDTETRALLATLLDARSEEMAFMPSALAGLATVAAGMDWQAGDSVVIAENDLMAQAPVWQTLMRQGVKIRLIPARTDEAITIHDVAKQLEARTKLAILSTAHPQTGAPLDLAEIGGFLRDRGVVFGVDATNTLGTAHLPTSCIDFLVADAHKWLLGPQGVAVLWIRRELAVQLRPAWLGQYAVPTAYASLAPSFITSDSARRLEFGNMNVIGLVGLHTSLTMINEIGVLQIAARLSDLRRFLLAGLTSLNIEPLDDPFSDLPRAVTTIRMRERDALSLVERLNEASIIVSLCADHLDHHGKTCLIRFAPHFYNTFAELQRLLEMLDRCDAAHQRRAVARHALLS